MGEVRKNHGVKVVPPEFLGLIFRKVFFCKSTATSTAVIPVLTMMSPTTPEHSHS